MHVLARPEYFEENSANNRMGSIEQELDDIGTEWEVIHEDSPVQYRYVVKFCRGELSVTARVPENYPDDPPAFELVEGEKGNLNKEMERKILLRIDEILSRSRGQPMLVRSVLDMIWSHSNKTPLTPTKEDVVSGKLHRSRKQKKRKQYILAASLGGLPSGISLDPGRQKVKDSKLKEQDERKQYILAASLGDSPSGISLDPGRQKVKDSKPKEQDESTKQNSLSSAEGRKLPAMKTARDVINRLKWDEQLKHEEFIVGYEDRFVGIIEVPVWELNWEDDISATGPTDKLAIPEHRIEHFKWNSILLWNKSTRTDDVFGSTGSSTTVVDVIQRYKSKHSSESGGNNESTENLGKDKNESCQKIPLVPGEVQNVPNTIKDFSNITLNECNGEFTGSGIQKEYANEQPVTQDHDFVKSSNVEKQNPVQTFIESDNISSVKAVLASGSVGLGDGKDSPSDIKHKLESSNLETTTFDDIQGRGPKNLSESDAKVEPTPQETIETPRNENSQDVQLANVVMQGIPNNLQDFGDSSVKESEEIKGDNSGMNISNETEQHPEHDGDFVKSSSVGEQNSVRKINEIDIDPRGDPVFVDDSVSPAYKKDKSTNNEHNSECSDKESFGQIKCVMEDILADLDMHSKMEESHERKETEGEGNDDGVVFGGCMSDDLFEHGSSEKKSPGERNYSKEKSRRKDRRQDFSHPYSSQRNGGRDDGRSQRKHREPSQNDGDHRCASKTYGDESQVLPREYQYCIVADIEGHQLRELQNLQRQLVHGRKHSARLRKEDFLFVNIASIAFDNFEERRVLEKALVQVCKEMKPFLSNTGRVEFRKRKLTMPLFAEPFRDLAKKLRQRIPSDVDVTLLPHVQLVNVSGDTRGLESQKMPSPKLRCPIHFMYLWDLNGPDDQPIDYVELGDGNDRLWQEEFKSYHDSRQTYGRGMRKDSKWEVTVSKKLSGILRHNNMGFHIDQDGYIEVNSLLSHQFFRHSNVTEEDIEMIVKNNAKKRFVLEGEPGKYKIRATQGHTVKGVDLQLRQIQDAEEFPNVIHGTMTKNLDGIMDIGLCRMKRNHIHMTTGLPREESVVSGMRNSSNCFIYMDLKKAMEDGIEFYVSENGVILSEGRDGVLHPKYFKKVVNRIGGTDREIPIKGREKL